MSYLPPTAAGAGEELPWPRVLVRMVLALLPSLLVGTLVATVLVSTLSGDGQIRGAWTLVVLPGLLAGAVLGLVLQPGRPRLLAYVVASVVVGLLLWVLLRGIVQLRVPRLQLDAARFLAGLLVPVGLQTVVAVAAWLVKARVRDR